MSNNMCEHGYTFGMCPKGCHETVSTADDKSPLPPSHEPALDLIHTDMELKCAICEQVVKTGKVYKGKPICDPCMAGLKGEAPEPPEVVTPSGDVGGRGQG